MTFRTQYIDSAGMKAGTDFCPRSLEREGAVRAAMDGPGLYSALSARIFDMAAGGPEVTSVRRQGADGAAPIVAPWNGL